MDHSLTSVYATLLKNAETCKTNDELRTWLLTILDEKYVKRIMDEMPDISSQPFLSTKSTSDPSKWIYGWADSLHDGFLFVVPGAGR